MNAKTNNETTDKTLFLEKFENETYTITMDDIEKVLIYHDRSNANVPHSPESTMMTLAGMLQKEYAMRKMYSGAVSTAHRVGDIHLHNADMPSRMYSMQFSEVVRVGNSIWPIGMLFDAQRETEISGETELAYSFHGNQVEDISGPVKVSKFMKHKVDKKMVYIYLKNGKSIICTEDHPFEVNGVLLQAKDLVSGMILPVKNAVKEDWMFKTNNVNGVELTKDFGWVLGMFITDGYYSRGFTSGSVGYELGIVQKDKEMTDKLVEVMNKLGMNPQLYEKEHNFIIRVYSKEWVEFFLNTMQVGKGSKRKCLPPNILQYNEDFVRGIVSGVVDGDGCVLPDEYGTTVNIGVASHGLVSQLQYILDVLGINSHCHMQFEEGKIQIAHIHGVERIMKQTMPIYRLNFRLTEEARELCQYSFKVKSKGGDKISIFKEITSPGQIVNIKAHPTIDEYVYDFTTDSHYFMVNGIRVHNCSGHSPSYIGKFGLSLPNLNSIAKPAKHADVFLEQLIKFAASMQGHFSGAIGFDAVNTFIAPYLVGLSDEKVKQCAQILVYEFAQQAVARGGQSLTWDTRILIRQKDTKTLKIVSIGEFCHSFIEKEGQKVFTEDEKKYETLSLNRKTGKLEWKAVNGVYVHVPASNIKEVKLGCGRSVKVTEDHSLFTIDAEGDFIEATTKDNPNTYLVAKNFPIDVIECSYTEEDAWAMGVMIGDGSVIGNVSVLNTSSLEVAERFSKYVSKVFESKGKIRPNKGIYTISTGKIGAEFFSVIGHGASNKKIPEEFYTAPESVVLSLLDGLLSSDGGVSRNRYEFYTTSEELKNGICFLLTRLGLEYGVRIRNCESNFHRNSPVFTILVNSTSSKLLEMSRKTRKIGPNPGAYSTSPHNFGIMKEKLKKDYGVGVYKKSYAFRSSRRKVKLEQLMSLSDKLDYVKKYINVLPMEVQSIEDSDEEEFVYDIGVDDNENFVLANGIIAHNTIFSDLNLYWGVPNHYKNVMAIGPGGDETGSCYKEYDEEAKRFMRALMQVYFEGDGAGRPFFFPKADCHITAESVDDEEYMNLLGSVASKMGSPYFVFDRGTDPSISQCCFDEYTKVLVRDDSGVRLMDIKDVRINENIKVFHNGSWVKFKRVETSRAGKRMFKIRTVHGKELIATEDHLFPTIRGDLRSDNLSTDDYVLFNTRTLQNEPHYEQGMTYEQGVLIGAFLGDGSFNGDGLTFSLDETSFNQLQPLIEKGYEDFTGEKRASSHYIKGKLHTLYIGANKIADETRKWINGGYAIDKSPSLNCLRESVDFRNGILDGWGMTDGGNSHRIYSVSKDMIDGFEAILNSLGIQCRVDLTDRTDEPMIIRGEVFKRNYPLYCLRRYDTKVHRNKEDTFKVRNNSLWFKIESVEEIKDYDKDTVYCFNVENEDEPYFTMPSGWIVHNCRLKLTLGKTDVDELKTPWKSRFTALQNVTMNLPAFAYQAKGDENTFNEILYKNMMLAKDAHQEKFNFIDRLFSLGAEGPLNLLLMEHDGTPYVRYDKIKFLIGMVGLNEAVQVMCGEELHESKEAYMLGMKLVAQMNANCKDVSKELGFTTILEQTPAESTAYRFARLDAGRYGADIDKYHRGSKEAPYYTNSTYLNVGANISPIERIKKEGKMHPLIDAGAISHIWMGEHTPSPESVAEFVRKTFYNTQNGQIAFSPEFTSCNICSKTSKGLLNNCPSCGSERVRHASRVTGFFSFIDGWNAGKKQELNDRHRVTL